ncbi:MAG: cell division ATP-binding protein FtsE [Bacteroidales bacterium]
MIRKPIIKFSKCSLYQADQMVLNDINLSVDKGEFVYIIGAVGVGKSTLIKSICAEILPHNGKLMVAEFNLSTIKIKEVPYLRRRLGIVFQDFRLLSDRSIEKNLEFVLKSTGWSSKNDIDKRLTEVLSLVGMERYRMRMPHELSGGEQQRVCIARAILNNPEIILADEPTAQLDSQSAKNIIKLLERLNNLGKTVLVSTHSQTLVEAFPHKTYELIDRTLHMA